MRWTKDKTGATKLAILRAVAELNNHYGYPTTFRQVATHAGVSENKAYRSLLDWRAEGMVTWTPNVLRTLRITDMGRKHLEARPL